MFRRAKQLTGTWSFFRNPLFWCGVAAVCGLVLGAIGAIHTQQAIKLVVSNRQSVLVAGPLTVDFGQTISAGFKATIEPQVPGKWAPQRSLLGASGVTFKPTGRLEAGRTYTVHITNLTRLVTGARIADISETVTAQVPAAIASVSPVVGAKNVMVKPQLKIKLATANHGVRELKASLNPDVALNLASNDDQTYTWEPATALTQGVTYTLSILDTNIADPAKQTLIAVPFTTVTPPVIVSSRTGGLFALGQTVDIAFDQPMDASGDFFSFAADGKGAWVDDHTYRFTPAGLKPGTSYHYTIKAGIKTKLGGVLEADRGFDFATNGAVSASTSPGGTDVGINTPIKVAFDQSVDHNSAESRFSIQPTVTGKFLWDGNTMTFVPNALAYQTTYSFAVAPGVVPNWGLVSNRSLGGSFTTAIEVIKLAVPAYKGQYWMACELASLSMLLAYRGVAVDQWAILMHLNYNPHPRDKSTNTWDDPNKVYVGDVNGRPNTTGYGVHAGPLAQAGREIGRNTTAYFNVNAAFIAGQIHAGNPVAFYSYSDAAPRADSWNTPGGYVVQTMYPQHARVIYGVRGSADNPLGFYINEPMDGSQMYWSAADVMAHMNSVPGVSNQAVVVF